MKEHQQAREGTGTGGEGGREGKKLAAVLAGRTTAALGALAGLVGGGTALWPTALANSLPSASLGVILGTVGYFLGARRLGVAAAIISAIALVLAIAAGQGLLPWMGPTDPIMR